MICENITIGANGHLHFAGQDTVALAKQYGTPLYLLDEDYFRRICRANYGSTLKSLNSFESVAISMAEGCFDGYDPLLFPEMFDSITREDLTDFIRRNLIREHMALSVVYPKE